MCFSVSLCSKSYSCFLDKTNNELKTVSIGVSLTQTHTSSPLEKEFWGLIGCHTHKHTFLTLLYLHVRIVFSTQARLPAFGEVTVLEEQKKEKEGSCCCCERQEKENTVQCYISFPVLVGKSLTIVCFFLISRVAQFLLHFEQNFYTLFQAVVGH